MYADDVSQRYGEGVIGIALFEIIAGGKRKEVQVVKGSQLLDIDLCIIERFFVERDVPIDPVEYRLEAFEYP